jgi:hypothetical protein
MQVGGWQGSTGSLVMGRLAVLGGRGWKEGAVSGSEEREGVGVLAVVLLGVMWDGSREWSVQSPPLWTTLARGLGWWGES